MENIKILVIIPILNPPEWFFSNVIHKLSSQTINLKILIINSGDPIPEGNYDVLSIDKKTFNHANTRNLALGYTADYYLFMTQDATPYNDHLIENLLSPFEDLNVVVSYARQIPYANADAIEVFARTTNYPPRSKIQSYADLPKMGIKTFFNSDSCAMYRGEYFRTVGGFKPDNNTSEDMEFAARAILEGKKIAYACDAKVYHSHNFTLRQVWRRYREIGTFFAYNRWILETVAQHTSTQSTGIQHAMNELNYLVRHAPLSIPRSIVLSITKYIAFKSSF